MTFPVVLVSLALVVLFSSLAVYRRFFYSPVKHQNDIEYLKKNYEYAVRIREMTERMAEVPCEIVHIKSRDGLSLEGRYYASRDPLLQPTVICVHGYRGISIMDFSGTGPMMMEEKMNVLLISQRGCMGSEGHTITFGIRERDDLLEWVKYVQERNGENAPVYLMGISMGAHTVLYSSSSLRGVNVRGIIADCPYTSSRAITDEVLSRAHFSPVLLRWFVNLTTWLWGGFLLRKEGATEEVRNTDIPVLLIHGTCDRLVPFSMSEEIASSNPDRVTLVAIEGAGHAMSYMTDREKYTQAVRAFVRSTV